MGTAYILSSLLHSFVIKNSNRLQKKTMQHQINRFLTEEVGSNQSGDHVFSNLKRNVFFHGGRIVQRTSS